MTKGIAGYLALCYARALFNKFKVTDNISEKVEKNYESFNKNLNKWGFLYGGIANTWRIPQDWVLNPIWNKLIFPAPTFWTNALGFVASLPIIPIGGIGINKILNSNIISSNISPETKTQVLIPATLALWYTLRPVVYSVVETCLFGDPIRNQEKLYKNKDNTASLLQKVDVSKHVFFGTLSDQAKNFAKALKHNIKTAKKAFLYSGKPGIGKSTDAIQIGIEAGADEIFITDSSEVGDRYISGQSENFKDLAKEVKKRAQENPDKRYAWIIEEVDQLALERGSNDSSQKDSSKTTNAFLTYIEKLKKMDNVFIISSTNLLGDMDTAGLRRIMDIHEEKETPTDEQRLEIAQSYIKKYNCSIHETVVEHVLTFTNGFPTYALKNIIDNLATLQIQESLNIITLDNNLDEINKIIIDELKKIVMICEGAQKKIARLGGNETTLKEIEKYAQTLQNNKIKLEEHIFSANLVGNLSYWKDALVNKFDKEEISKIQNECIKNLNDHYEQLPKTSEQIYLDEQLNTLNKTKNGTAILTISQSIDTYFDPKTISQTSLQEQIDILEAILEELNNFKQFDEDTIYDFTIEMSMKKIKEYIQKLKHSFTFSSKTTEEELLQKKHTYQDSGKQLILINDQLEKCVAAYVRLVAMKASSNNIEIAKNKINELKNHKSQAEKDCLFFKQISSALELEKRQGNVLDIVLKLLKQLQSSEILKDPIEATAKRNNIKNYITSLINAKQFQKNHLKQKAEHLITIANDTLLDSANTKKKLITKKIESMKNQVLTFDQLKFSKIIHQLETNPTEEIIKETIDTIKQESGIKNIVIKKDINKVVIKNRNDIELDYKAKELSDKIGTTIEQTKFLITLITDKKTNDITVDDTKKVYSEKIVPMKSDSFFINIPWLFSLGQKYTRKDIFLAVKLQEMMAGKNKVSFNNKQLLKFSSIANTFYEQFVMKGEITEDDYNCLMHLQGLKEEEYKKMKNVINKDLSINDYKLLMNEHLKDIKKEDKKIYFKDIKKENEITDKIKLFAFINKIPDHNNNYGKHI